MTKKERLDFLMSLSRPNVKRVLGFGNEPDFFDVEIDPDTIIQVSAVDGSILKYQNPVWNTHEHISSADIDTKLETLRDG